MTTITIERAFLIKVLDHLDIAQSLLERSQHHAKIAAMYKELRAALAAPATAPDDQLLKDAERYRWCVDNNLVLAGGTREFGWQIAPVGREWNRFIDAAMKGTP